MASIGRRRATRCVVSLSVCWVMRLKIAQEIKIHPSSVLAGHRPAAIMFSELVRRYYHLTSIAGSSSTDLHYVYICENGERDPAAVADRARWRCLWSSRVIVYVSSCIVLYMSDLCPYELLDLPTSGRLLHDASGA